MSKKAPSPRRTHVKEAHTVMQEALLHVGDGTTQSAAHKHIAKHMGVSASMLYKWREPASSGSGQPNPLERVANLILATGDERIVDWLAQKAGGHFIRIESSSHTPILARDANALIKEFSLLIAEVVGAAEDNRILPDESQILRTKWNALSKRTEAFVRACEKGSYGPST